MTQPLEWYTEQADDLEQRVTNAWGQLTSAGDNDNLTPEFKALFNLACEYRSAKRLRDNRREFGAVTDEIEKNVDSTRAAFAQACRSFDKAAAQKAAAQ